MKKKKPTFLRQDAPRMVRLGEGWRAPRGRHSKMRGKFKGRRIQPSIGWRSPRAVRGLTRQGYPLVVIHSLEELLAHKTGPVTIARTLGTKKRLEIVKKAKELKIVFVNLKNPDAFVKGVEERIQAKKKQQQIKQEKVKKREEDAKAKEKAAGKEKTEEEKEKEVKEEKRKVLEQR